MPLYPYTEIRITHKNTEVKRKFEDKLKIALIEKGYKDRTEFIREKLRELMQDIQWWLESLRGYTRENREKKYIEYCKDSNWKAIRKTKDKGWVGFGEHKAIRSRHYIN